MKKVFSPLSKRTSLFALFNLMVSESLIFSYPDFEFVGPHVLNVENPSVMETCHQLCCTDERKSTRGKHSDNFCQKFSEKDQDQRERKVGYWQISMHYSYHDSLERFAYSKFPDQYLIDQLQTGILVEDEEKTSPFLVDTQKGG